MSLPHPEFKASIDQRVADAALALVQANTDLATYFTGGISDYESEAFVKITSIAPPALAQWIYDVDEARHGSSRQARVTTVLAWGIIVTRSTGNGTNGHLVARLADSIKRIFATEGGIILDPSDSNVRLTQALLQFRRLGTPAALDASPSLIMHRLFTVHQSDISELTGDPI